MVIRLEAVRNVSAGEEVTISYINEDRPPSARRENLASAYHFYCSCSRCTKELSIGSAKYSYSRSANNHGRKGAKKKEARAAARAKPGVTAPQLAAVQTKAAISSPPDAAILPTSPQPTGERNELALPNNPVIAKPPTDEP